jgi:hypothetical protein
MSTHTWGYIVAAQPGTPHGPRAPFPATSHQPLVYSHRPAAAILGGRRAHLHCVTETLVHGVVEGVHVRPRQVLQRRLLLLLRDPVRWVGQML